MPKVSPRASLEVLGFKTIPERRQFLQDHSAEILADYQALGFRATQRKWHIGSPTLRRMTRGITLKRGQPKPSKPVTAKDFATAILEGYATLKTENFELKQQVKALELVLRAHELEEERRKIENEQMFQAKVNKALAEPGEN